MKLKSTLLAFLLVAGLGSASAQEEPPVPPPDPNPDQAAQEGPKPAFEDREGSIEALKRALETSIRDKRKAAEEAIGKIIEDLAWDYRETKNLLDKRFAAIAKHGRLVSDLLVEKITQERETPENRNLSRNVCRVLRLIADPDIAEDLIALLQNKSQMVRANTAFVLGVYRRDPKVEQALLKLLEDPSWKVRGDAISSLGEIRSQAAAPLLAAMLGNEKLDQHTRREIVHSMALIGSSEGSEKAIAAFTQTGDTPLKTELVLYFQAAGVEDAVDLLLDSLRDAVSLELRKAELEALGILTPATSKRKVIPVLKGYLQDRTYSVRATAAIALYRLKDHSGLTVLLQQPLDAIKKNPGEPFGYLARADIYVQLEEWAKAASDYKSALKRANKGQLERDVHYRYARCYAEMRQFDRAVRVLRDADIAPQDFAASEISRLPCFERMREEERFAEWFTAR